MGTVEPLDSDDKYITFKREEFLEKTNPSAMNMATAEIHRQELLDLALPDAVVIRRQDLFASPALATYSSCISLVAVFNKRDDLLAIADYFQRQSELAAEEGWKIPDV